MIVVPVILYFLSETTTQALNTTSTNSFGVPFSVRDTACSCPQLRSTWDILWSCLGTIVACTWVSIHPNSPGLEERSWRIAMRRLELMIWTVLIPEMIIYWALRQWLGARRIADFYKDFGWTRTHGHFLQMGGFVLADENQDLEVITDERFYDLLDKGIIKFPSATEDQIQALSKGDGLSKIVVIGQTSWFIAQCISRVIQGLRLTELELVTLAFAFLNGFMYFLWWDKPLDAEYLIRVSVSADPTPILLPSWIDSRVPTTALLSEVEVKESRPRGSTFDTPSHETRETEGSSQPVHDPACRLDNVLSTETTLRKSSRINTIKRLREIGIFCWRRLSQMRGSHYDVTSNTKRVPTFYAVSHRINIIAASNLAISIIGVMFGAIHCAGWNFVFPTRVEMIMWRTNAILIAAYPILMILHALLIMIGGIPQHLSGPRLKGIVLIGEIFWKCLPLYFLGRMVLLLEAFITLRALPEEAFLQVQWTRFLPHI